MIKKNKMLQIWTLAISALWIISLSNSNWKIFDLSKDENEFKLVNTSFADDEDKDKKEDNDLLNPEITKKVEISSRLFKAPNSKVYSLINNNWIVSIKKSDWTYSSKTFSSYDDAKTYLDKNALPPKVVAKPIIKKTVAKVTTTAKKTTALNTKVTKTVVKKPLVTVTKPVVTKPVVSTPKVDTTTKAS